MLKSRSRDLAPITTFAGGLLSSHKTACLAKAQHLNGEEIILVLPIRCQYAVNAKANVVGVQLEDVIVSQQR